MTRFDPTRYYRTTDSELSIIATRGTGLNGAIAAKDHATSGLGAECCISVKI